MTLAVIMKQVKADGVSLALSPSGTIKATGDGAAVNRWLSVIREYKAGIIEALKIDSPPMTSREEKSIRDWLAHINETDACIINDVLDKCRIDTNTREYFYKRADNLTPKMVQQIKQSKAEILAELQRGNRRQKVIALMEDSPDSQRVYYTDMDTDPENVILAVGIQYVVIFEMLIPRDKYDPFKLLELIERHGQITH